jgi:hypothetical protein
MIAGTTRQIGRISLAALLLTASVALVIHLTCATAAQHGLGFRFPGVPATLDSAVSIFINNTRKLAGLFGLALILQCPWLDRRQPRGECPAWIPALRPFADCAVAGVLLSTFLLTAVGLGAYGARMGRAVMPHGPIELVAFATGLALYLDARRDVVSARRALALATLSIVLLAAAALTETYLSL